MIPRLIHPFIRPKHHRVFGGLLNEENVKFCLSLGHAISRGNGLILVTGGFKNKIKNPVVLLYSTDVINNDKW